VAQIITATLHARLVILHGDRDILLYVSTFSLHPCQLIDTAYGLLVYFRVFQTQLAIVIDI